MAELKIIEREYIIPLRRAWLRVPVYERSRKAVKTIKYFIAKHMKVLDRDVNKVKLDVYFNNEIWFRGRANPPGKVKVRARKEGEVVHVSFAETPEQVKFLKIKHERFHKKLDKKEESSGVQQPKEAEKSEEKNIEEKEKVKATAEMNIKEAEKQAKEQKHLTPIKEPKIQRMALKK